MTIDTQTLTNWFVPAFLGLCIGVVTAWFAYRYERRRDDIAWEREKIKRREDWEQELETLRLQWAKDEEKVRQQLEQEQQKLRQQLEHERDLVILQSQQRLKEIEQQFLQQDRNRIREEILKGLDNPAKAIQDLEKTKNQLEQMRHDLARFDERKNELYRAFNSVRGFDIKYEERYRELWHHFEESQRRLEQEHYRLLAEYRNLINNLPTLGWIQRSIAVGIWLVIPIMLLMLIRLFFVSP